MENFESNGDIVGRSAQNRKDSPLTNHIHTAFSQKDNIVLIQVLLDDVHWKNIENRISMSQEGAVKEDEETIVGQHAKV